MIFVYDILVNFQKEFFDFFEWNENDDIIHIKKIPLFKIDNSCFDHIKKNIVIFDKGFLKEIQNRAEKFSRKYCSVIPYCCLLSNGKEAMAIKLNKNGFVIGRSSLLLDENDDVINMAKTLNKYHVNFTIFKICFSVNNKTRYEKKQQAAVFDMIDKLYRNSEFQKLQFLFFECFGKDENNMDKIVENLKKEIKTHSNNYNRIIEFFKLISR